jgi:hypothetical protein
MPRVVIHPDEFIVITSADHLPSLNNGSDVVRIMDNKGVLIDSINYDLNWYHDHSKSSGGYSIERLNPDVSSNDITNWYVSQYDSGGTPGRRNSVFGRNPDSVQPTIIDIRFQIDSITVKFSEPVAPIDDIGGFHTVFRKDTTAVIYLENLTNGSTYTVTIDSIQDLAGNYTTPKDFTFTYFIAHPVHTKDIIITEIMADPSPVVQLPEAEYLEVYNRSSYPVSFSGWHLEDPTTSAQLPSVILMPDSYLLFASTTNAPKFSKAVGVVSFPSLGNLGDRIVLRDPNGIAIDSIVYNTSWYHSSEKSDGGWSLELIDVNNPCGEGDNWTASEDPDGGTPGKINSVFANKPDVTPPKALGVFALSPDSILITFDEELRNTGTISLSSRSFFKDLSKRDVVYVLTESISVRTLYSITITDVYDCNGNLIEPTTISFALPEAAEQNDIVINEVLFNPRPNGYDFVELYNKSDKYINLKNWNLSGFPILDKDFIMTPMSYLAITPSIVSIQSNYPSAVNLYETSLPSMPDDEGTITMIDNAGDTIDHFTYSDDMHSKILSDTEGISLERISANVATDDRSNWHSANTSAGYATPGYVNSNSRPDFAFEESTISLRPEVINPSGSAPFSQIFYHFDRGGSIANVSVVDPDGRVIKTIAANETIGTEGSFQWDGDRSDGSPARCGYYMVWFQVFDLEGKVKTYRNRVVVGF